MLDSPFLIPITLAFFLVCCAILLILMFKRHIKSIEFHKEQMESYSNFSRELIKYKENSESVNKIDPR